jgi:uncharacterized protein (TIGR03083 family)
VKVSEHLDHFGAAGRRLAAAAAAAGPDAPVPSCPDWVVRDLVRHQGGIHRWATGYVEGRRTDQWDVDLDEVVGTWPDDANLIDWFTAGHAHLVEVLAATDPGLECWTFLRAPSPLAMWSRRQAHETTVHGVDAELAAGLTPASVPPEFAADGVDELLCCFITRPFSRLKASQARRLRVTCTDADGDWLVTIGPDGPPVTVAAGDAAGTEAADCLVSGRAEDLYLVLWNRRSPEVLTVEGDAEVLDLFTDKVRVRWA